MTCKSCGHDISRHQDRALPHACTVGLKPAYADWGEVNTACGCRGFMAP